MARLMQGPLDEISGLLRHPSNEVVCNSTTTTSEMWNTTVTSEMTKSVELSVDPVSCLHDEPICIRVSSLVPSEDVTLQASMKDTRGVHFLSYAHYRANESGQVDLATMESLGGHYKGIFPMGLIGSLLPAPEEYRYTRFFKRDVQNPSIVKVTVHRGHLNGRELCSPDADKPLATVTHLRHYMAPGVQRIPVRSGKVRGCLFLPPGDGPFPGVVDMFGTAGGLLEYRSAQLASQGFASLALAFFNYEDLPKSVREYNIAYFEEAVEFLLKHEKVLHHGVGVIGTSKGGDLALSMAAFIPSVRVCVVINGYNVPIGAGLRVKDHLYPPLPFSYSGVRISDDGAVDFMCGAHDPRHHPKSILPIEQSQAAFLFLVGSDDRNVKSEFYAQLARQRLSEHKYSRCCEVSSYPGAGHLLEPPYSPHCFASFQHTFMMPVIWGGTVKHHIIGQEKAWSKMREFLWFHLVHGNVVGEGASKCNQIRKSNL
ncbi:acyl-coenzyme A thioesterase 1-like [Panulirus ornatus]|uniref:acyl-coenzyme A thioesterase 1-like n=1 Tax=Panulirus ornatus TaxID=150431 RepID=UPI003A878B4A